MSFLADRSAVSIGLGGVVSLTTGNIGAIDPLTLFANGEQGAWYDPSDLTTLFQDAAGITPVTGIEQPVGLMRDKSGRNNHASQSTSASRPVLSARVNLLTETEQLTGSAWAADNITVTSGASDPLGGTTAFTLTASGVSVLHELYQLSTGSNRLQTLWIRRRTGSGAVQGYVDDAYASWGSITSTWQQFSLLQVTANPSYFLISLADGDAVDVWHPDLRVANTGIGLPSYQRVNTATDYDTTGFPLYLACDGVDDGMVTGSIDFTATDKITVWAGLRKLSDAVFGAVAEISTSIGSNNGVFVIAAPQGTAPTYGLRNKGTILTTAVSPSIYAAPITNVFTGIGDISGDSAILRLNASQVASSNSDQGTGNYGNYPLYLFRRGGTTFPFNGRFYGLIVRGAQSTSTQVVGGEKYMNQKTKAY